jgi:polyphosphate kinase
MPFLNRELGILAFNERVLYQSQDPSVPLLERLRFLAIVSSNLDEFFEVRVASLKRLIVLDGPETEAAKEQLVLIAARAQALVAKQYQLLNDEILPALRKQGIEFYPAANWTQTMRAWALQVFNQQIEPLLTPVALDGAHPFPRIYNKSLNFIVELSGVDAFGRAAQYGVIGAPRALPRVLTVPHRAGSKKHGLILLTSIVRGFIDELFPGRVKPGIKNQTYQFRVTRDSELELDDSVVVDLRDAIEDELSERNFGHPVRLEVSNDMPEDMIKFLVAQFNLTLTDVYSVDGPVNLMRLQQVPEMVPIKSLKYQPFVPLNPAAFDKRDLFAAIRRKDVLVHHPYESFAPVMDFLRSAATDDRVVAIKQTIYRTGADSQLMEALIAAAKEGKEVTVVLELMARFDEQANVDWADRLERVGAHVVYGVVGLKTHAKLAQVIRREGKVLRRYSHIGTGNYHPRTAKLYEDFGVFTANESICDDVHEVFRRLTGAGSNKPLNHLWLAPTHLHSNVVKAIKFETAQALKGKPARIIAKMNSLLEEAVIEALYEASKAGVKIDLIVRGVCALRPGVKGMSENISVRSVVGRFLEHSRIFHFHAAGKDLVYIASCDWMDRNFFRRVEVACPILDPKIKRRVLDDGLLVYLKNERSVWLMDGKGRYHHSEPTDVNSITPQQALAGQPL